MLEWIRNDLTSMPGEPVGNLKVTGLVSLALIGIFLALAAVFSIPLHLILLPFAGAGVLVLFFFKPTWGIITSIFLLSIKRLFTVMAGALPMFTVNRALIFWVLLCLLLHRFVFRTREQFHPHDQNRVALLFVVWYSISTILALDKTYAMHVYAQIVGNILLFFLIYQLIENQKQLGVLYLGYITLLPASGVLSIIGFKLTGSRLFTGSGVLEEAGGTEWFRAAGVAGMGPNNYAVVTVLFIVTLTMLLWWRDLKRWHRGAILVVIASYLFMLSQTLSRTGMILFILATILFVSKHWKRIGTRRIILGGLLAGLLIGVLATERVVDRFTSISKVKDLNLSEDQSISNRIGLTLMLPKLISINPVFGVGPGNIAYLTSKSEYRNYVARNLKGTGFVSHNQYVELIGETGIIGFAIFALMMGLCVRDVRASRRMLADREGTFLWCLTEALTLILPLYFLAAATLECANKQAFWIIVAMPIIIRRLLENGDGGTAESSTPAKAVQ
jgi:O-antigen ligase